ncbi:hypothetical protein OXX79_006932 [Metschnikowia pulcherrima]
MRFNSALIATTVLSAFVVAAPSNTNMDSRAILSKRETEEMSRNAAGNLDMLYRDMRKYVFESGFEYPEFEGRILDTRQFLANIEFEVENLPVKVPLANDVAYVSKVWDIMSFASEKMSRYSNFKWPGDKEMYKVLDSYVSAMTLFNVHGELDLDIENVGASARKLEETVRKSIEDFNKVSSRVAPGMRKLFQNVSKNALYVIEMMGPVSN